MSNNKAGDFSFRTYYGYFISKTSGDNYVIKIARNVFDYSRGPVFTPVISANRISNLIFVDDIFKYSKKEYEDNIWLFLSDFGNKMGAFNVE